MKNWPSNCLSGLSLIRHFRSHAAVLYGSALLYDVANAEWSETHTATELKLITRQIGRLHAKSVGAG